MWTDGGLLTIESLTRRLNRFVDISFIALSRECQYFFVGRIYRFKGLT